MTLGDILRERRLVVCVGTGGVGKTTVSAALALGAALEGRNAMVLTIDPARQLARALGLSSLEPGGQPVPADALADAGLSPSGRLHAGMLDPKRAWDAFIERHSPSATVRDRILENPFYQSLSSSFAGSGEYMAIEELCRLDESGVYDTIVLDTPPAAHAFDFLRAPERIDRLLLGRGFGDSARSAGFPGVPGSLGLGAWRAAGVTARWLVHRLERATGRRTLRDITAFFTALDALIDRIRQRTRAARALFREGRTAFVLVAGPEQLVLDETAALATHMQALDAHLGGLVLNRVHPLAGAALPSTDELEAAFAEISGAGAPPDAVRWLRQAFFSACADGQLEGAALARFEAALPRRVARVRVPEFAHHELRSLADLARVAEHLWR